MTTPEKPKHGGAGRGQGRHKIPDPLVMWYLRVSPELKKKLQSIPAEELRTALLKLVAPRE